MYKAKTVVSYFNIFSESQASAKHSSINLRQCKWSISMFIYVTANWWGNRITRLSLHVWCFFSSRLSPRSESESEPETELCRKHEGTNLRRWGGGSGAGLWQWNKSITFCFPMSRENRTATWTRVAQLDVKVYLGNPHFKIIFLVTVFHL